MAVERREFLRAIAAGALFPRGVLGQGSRADRLFQEAIVIDSLAMGHEWDQAEYDAVKRSGYTGIQTTLSSESFEVAIGELAEWNRRIRDNPEKLVHATKAVHVERAKSEGKMAVVFGFQNATMLEGKVENLDPLFELGTRCIQLTYNARNLLGDGCTERTNAGLSDFGVGVVERMNELGIIVDLSHCGPRTSSDGIEVSRKPPAFTHTFCEALYRGHPRAKTDELLRAMSDRGGMTGIAALGYFIGPSPDTSIEDYLNHVDHAVKVAGIGHVGLATDFQVRGIKAWATRETWYEPRLKSFKPSYNVRWPPWIEGLDEPERFLNVARGLERRGYPEDDIQQLLGGNWLRYFRDIFNG